jgi:hypothetical protein
VHELLLSGSPLALAANADSADDWLRCDVDPGRVQVTVTPEAVGECEGTVVLSTPIGDHQVPVRVAVVPATVPEAAVPKARRAPRVRPVTAPPADRVAAPPVEAIAQPLVEPVAPPTRTPPAAAPVPAAEPADVSPSGGGAGPGRLWWPVSAALLLIAIGWLLEYWRLGDLLWYQPSAPNLPPSFLGDGFSLAPLVVIASVIGALWWPRLAGLALGVASGVALFFLTWSLVFLGASRIRDDSSVAPLWRGFFYLGLATMVVVPVELWHRHLLGGRPRWRRPTLLEAGLFALGAFLSFKALTKILDYEKLYELYGKPSLVLPVFTVALSGLAIVTRISDDRATVIVTAAVAYVGVSSLALLYVAAQAHAPFADMLLVGNSALLLAFVARLAQDRWPHLHLPKRRSPPATKASVSG